MDRHRSKLYQLQEEMMDLFEKLVFTGVKFPYPMDVLVSAQEKPASAQETIGGPSVFQSTGIVANPNYKMKIGENLTVAYGQVEFETEEDGIVSIEPELTDLHWLAELLDCAELLKST
jgi:hypothetical protein